MAAYSKPQSSRNFREFEHLDELAGKGEIIPEYDAWSAADGK